MPDMTAEDLKQHLKLLTAASTEELDELLHDLLVKVYPTKVTQASWPRRRAGAGTRRPRVSAREAAPGRRSGALVTSADGGIRPVADPEAYPPSRPPRRRGREAGPV